MYTELIKDIDKIESFKEGKLKKAKILLIEGTHSQENLLYKNNEANPTRGIDSLSKCFSAMNLDFKMIESTDPNIFDELKNTDIVFPYAHGEYGEDGRLQGVMDYINLPYIGSGVLGSAICADKLTFKRVINEAGIPTALYSDFCISKSDNEIINIADEIGFPVMVKLRNGGSSIGLYKINDRQSLQKWMSEIPNKEDYFFEKFIPGRFLTVGILCTENGIRHLPILEVKSNAEFYDEKVKLGVDEKLKTEFIINPDLDESVVRKVLKSSYKAYEVCNCKSVARIDFIINDLVGPIILEINTIPGVAENSNITAMFYSLGYTYEEAIIEILMSGCYKK